MADLLKALIPLAVLIAVFGFAARSTKKTNHKLLDAVEEQTQEMQKFNTIAHENLDLMRRQVAALEEIAKKR